MFVDLMFPMVPHASNISYVSSHFLSNCHVRHHNHLGPNLLSSPPPIPPHHTLSPTSMAPKRKRVGEPPPEDKSAGSGATPAEVSKVKVEPQEPCMSY